MSNAVVSATVGGSGDDDVVTRLPQRLTLTLSDTNSMNDLLRGVPRESSLRGFTSQSGGLLVSSALPRDSQRKKGKLYPSLKTVLLCNLSWVIHGEMAVGKSVSLFSCFLMGGLRLRLASYVSCR